MNTTPGDNQPPNPPPLMGAATSTPAATPEPRVIVVKFDEPEKPAPVYRAPVVVRDYGLTILPVAACAFAVVGLVMLYFWMTDVERKLASLLR